MQAQKLDSYIEDSAKLFAYVADKDWAQFLDSGQLVGEKTQLAGKIDTLVFSPKSTLVTKGEVTRITSSKEDVVESLESPFHLVANAIEPYKNNVSDDALLSHQMNAPFYGGAIGYFGYELGKRVEDLPNKAVDDLALPDMAIGIYEVALVTCHDKRETWLIDATGENDQLIDEWLALVNQYWHSEDVNMLGQKPWTAISGLQENISKEEYKIKFDQVKRYLHEGDAYQINLTKRFSVKVEGCAWASYERMRQLSPAPFGAYMNFPFATILSNSPEQFVECYSQVVKTSPIKGTRPRDNEVLERDLELAEELENSVKDRAENVMIVDLLRNDFGKICETGSVKVPQLFAVESFANVHHLVSQVTGKLKADANALGLLEASFPGGSITGAPKKRAMEIIDELEPHYRGVYCGAIGWVGFAGNMQTNIAIRTITYSKGTAYFSAGGGIVMDSICDEEYQEIRDKAAVMFGIVGANK